MKVILLLLFCRELSFRVNVPPLGIQTYFVSIANAPSELHSVPNYKTYKINNGNIVKPVLRGGGLPSIDFYNIVQSSKASMHVIENQKIRIEFDHNGNAVNIENKSLSHKMQLKSNIAEYSTSRSGAYIFRFVY